jgi:hypothetical protein
MTAAGPEVIANDVQIRNWWSSAILRRAQNIGIKIPNMICRSHFLAENAPGGEFALVLGQ